MPHLKPVSELVKGEWFVWGNKSTRKGMIAFSNPSRLKPLECLGIYPDTMQIKFRPIGTSQSEKLYYGPTSLALTFVDLRHMCHSDVTCMSCGQRYGDHNRSDCPISGGQYGTFVPHSSELELCHPLEVDDFFASIGL